MASGLTKTESGLPMARMPPTGHTFSLITKVTRICNLRCHYCNEWEDTKTVMSFRTLAQLTNRALGHPDAKAVTFIWHGGEPLVRGRDFYNKALYLQKHCRRDRQTVKNAIQTNGTLVNADWATQHYHELRVKRVDCAQVNSASIDELDVETGLQQFDAQ